MSYRLIDCNPSDFNKFSADDLVESIRNSEGRVVMSEVIVIAPPLIDKVSNVEMAAAFGADMVLLNLYDVYAPQIMGMPSKEEPQNKTPRVKFLLGKAPLALAEL